PLSPCSTTQLQVHLSGGDITGVLAGSGLDGGGKQGSVTLQVDQSTIPTGITAGFGLLGGGTGGDITLSVNPAVVQRRIIGTCNIGFGGQAIADVAQDGSIVCSNGPFVLSGAKAGPVDMTENFSEIATLHIPEAADYLVMAKVVARANHPLEPLNDYMDATCRLTVAGEQDFAIVDGDVDFAAGGTMTMIVATSVPANTRSE